jgi:hypothetical protein
MEPVSMPSFTVAKLNSISFCARLYYISCSRRLEQVHFVDAN